MKVCEICGAEITNRHSNNIKYCSEKCAREAEKRHFSEYRKDRTRRGNKIQGFRQKLYKAYGYSCAICGWQASLSPEVPNGTMQMARGCALHHIVPVKENGTDDETNLILLCPNHHKQADFGIISREDLIKYLKPVNTEKDNDYLPKSISEFVAAMIFGTTNYAVGDKVFRSEQEAIDWCYLLSEKKIVARYAPTLAEVTHKLTKGELKEVKEGEE